MAANMINDRFLLLGPAARPGGLSEVRKAVDTSSANGDFAAIKLLRQREDDEVIEIFLERETSALKALQHPHIVKMLDSGWDESHGQYFIALEWVERSLKDEMADGRPMAWPAYFERIGKALASALAHAHSLQIEHRDLKPGNVLMAEDGTPKLADFGIAKIRSKVTVTDETVADFRSSLYTPPEQEDSIPYVRDVFGYGVLAIQVLSGGRASDYPDLAPVLDEVNLAPEVRTILRTCIDYDPKKRPANAAVLEQRLLEAEQVSGNRQARRSNYMWLRLTRAAAQTLSEAPKDVDPDWDRAKAAVLAEIGGTVHIDYGHNARTDEVERDVLRIFGRSWCLYLKADEQAPERSAIIRALTKSEEWLARRRERALLLEPILTWTFDDPGEDAAFQGRDLLLNRLDDHIERREQADNARQARNLGDLFDGWRRLLDAREEVAAGGRQMLEYDRVTGNGRNRVFQLIKPNTAQLVGEEWSVAAYADGRPLERGEITAQTDETLVIRFRRPDTRLPDRGVLLPFLGPSQVSLNRQRDALTNVAAGRTTNPRLRAIIDDPTCIEASAPTEVASWFRTDLDKSKRNVVLHALNSDDLLLVEGPPGTGKTTVIAEIVEQTLKRTPHARILIVSQTHIAIDNALRRIEESGVTDLVRLGHSDDPRIAESVQPLLLDRQVKRWTQSVRARAEKYLDETAARNGFEAHHIKAALLLEELASVAGNLEHVTGQLQELTSRPTPERTTSARDLGEEVVTARARRDQLVEQRHELFVEAQRVLVGELTLREELTKDDARAAVEALIGPKGPGRALLRLLRLQGEWLQRIGTDQNLLTAFLRTRKVIGGTALGFLGHPAARDLDFDLCIFDEASKATATEALVPLARARRWILVGDTR